MHSIRPLFASMGTLDAYPFAAPGRPRLRGGGGAPLSTAAAAPEPAAYATFFKTVVTRARAANPDAKFLLAADPQPFHDGNGNWTTESWNDLAKAAPDGPAGIALAEAVTVHPYNG